MPLEFDPNKNYKGVWATYIPKRYPSFRIYNRKGDATGTMTLNAGYGRGSPSILYTIKDDKWVEIDRYEPPTHCAWCGEELKLTLPAQRLHKSKNSPGFKKPVVCGKCYDEHFKYHAPDPIDHNTVRSNT